MNLKKIGIVAAGGGFLGAITVGFLKAVETVGLKFKYFQGSSVAAIVGAFITEQNG